MCLLASYMSSLKNVCLDLLPFFFDWMVFLLLLLLLCCVSCLYHLEINSFSIALFANIFPQSVGSLFFLLMISFVVQKLMFDYVPFVYFYFYFYCLERLIVV